MIRMKKFLAAIFSFIMLVCFALAPANAFAITCGGVEVYSQTCPDELTPVTDGESKITKYVNNVLNVLFIVAGTVAVIVIIYGGIMYMTAAGDPGKIASAKKAIMFAVVGLVISVSAFAITNFLIDALRSGNGSTDESSNVDSSNSNTATDDGDEVSSEEPVVGSSDDTIKVDSLSLPTSITLTEGEAQTVTLTKTPSNATEKINWRSGSTNIATVTSRGRIVARRAGNTTITAKSASGKQRVLK